jgi:DNA primase small subunit
MSHMGDDEKEKKMPKCLKKSKLKNKKFGPYNNEKISLPTYAAAYLICKKLATIA